MAKKTKPTQKKARQKKALLPGFIAFTREVLSKLWSDKRLFAYLFLVTTAVTLVLFGTTQQDQYVTTSDALDEYRQATSDESINSTVEFGVLLATAATGGLNTTLSETQRVYLFFLYLLVWLATIWLLRHRMAGVAVTVRDGLYNAGAPVIPILALFFIGVFQLLPMAIGIIVYSAATTTGILHGVFETSLFAIVALALSVLSLYWVASTFFAVIIATNQGTYPIAALKAAKGIVAGRRLQLALRLTWLAALLAVLWAIVLVPAVLLDSWISQEFLPVVVLSVQLLSAFSIIFGSSYIYLLYRKMIDEPAS